MMIWKLIYFRDENKKINDSPRSSSPPPRGLTECNPEFRNNSERSELPQTAAPPKSSTMDDMSEIKPGILEMIQEEQRVSPIPGFLLQYIFVATKFTT